MLLLPAAVMPVRAARVLVELMDTPGRVNLRLLFMDSDMASVKRKGVESFNTCFVLRFIVYEYLSVVVQYLGEESWLCVNAAVGNGSIGRPWSAPGWKRLCEVRPGAVAAPRSSLTREEMPMFSRVLHAQLG